MLNIHRSLELGQVIGAEPKHCYENASYALFQLYDEGRADGVYYVEGYVVSSSGPPISVVKHGWLECDTGEILDPSLWAYAQQNGETHLHFISYHPAVRFTYAEFMAQYREQEFLPLAPEGEHHRRAFDEAYGKM